MALDPFDSRTFVREVATRFHLSDAQPQVRPAEVDTSEGLKGADLLRGGSIEIVFQRLANGDPLGVRFIAQKYLRRNGFILDLERVVGTSMAYAAYLAERDEYDGDPPLQVFLEKAIEQSVETIGEEDRAKEMRGEPMDPLSDPYARVGFAPEVDPAHVRHAVLRFNGMQKAIRVPCYRVLVEGATFEEAVDGTNLSTAELEGHVTGILSVIANPPKLVNDTKEIDNLLDRILANTRRPKQ